ncbi:hypothetical protein EJB05_26522 [Eragrostis curvula]|uniref:AAA+ ATPase domain-containing protein n=1 Tax=Eragrostis curvula TaxID=38414 RepID=A0A5J9UL06_9POAL|nr:hypothetical protein EJB05_26522 [Eragrostis curvula]
MEFATGAFGTLLPKLAQLLEGEYKLQKNVRKNIESLKKELEYTHAALRSVGEVPPEELKEVVRLWARDARELSYDMEDVVDTFLVHVEGPDPPSRRRYKRFVQKMKSILAIGKRHHIGEQMEDIMKRAMDVAARRDRYKDDIDNVSHVATLDPRITALFTKASKLVGIDEAMEEVIMKLTKGDDRSTQQQRIVSIVGFGGLGKTTLAKAVYDKLKMQFDCAVFVTVSRNPDMLKFLKKMLYELDNQKYGNIDKSLDVYQLINLAQKFLKNKRYFIIVDDIWDIPNWDIIKCALPDDSSRCTIITTTRNITVADHIGENFVTVLSDTENTSALTKARRLSLQNSDADHASTWGTRSMPQVRSVVVFSSAINQIPALQNFKVLRVLNLEDCDLSQGYSLKYLGSLLHLRYLNLNHTGIDQLPKEVENLQFLETLDIQYNCISHLQLNIAQFKHLFCLLVDSKTKVSNGIWSLMSLEELSWLHMDDELMDHIEELGLITELRVLRMMLHTDKWNNKMVESLSKLRKIQILCISHDGGQRNFGGLDAWVAPGHLRHLYTGNGCWFSRLPAWLNNPSHLADLCKLYIAVRELQEKDLNVLGRLPALTYLSLLVDHESLGIRERFVVGAGSFPCLVYCLLMGFIVPVVFQNGAAPRLTRFDFDFHVREVREIAGSDGGFDLGLQNLPSLQGVGVGFQSGGASEEEVEEAKAAESWTGRVVAGHVQGHHLGGSAVPLVLPQHVHHGTRDRQDRRHAALA